MPLHLLPPANPRFLEVTSRPLFSPTDCAEVLGSLDPDRWRHAQVEGEDDGGHYAGVRPDERSVTHQPLPLTGDGWPLFTLLDVIAAVNEEIYRYDLSGIEAHDYPNVLRYEMAAADHFRPHEDTGPHQSTRKLSFSVQLSPSADYQGCDLIFPHRGETADREQGTLTVFPSILRHTVTPVIRGTRYAIVGWIHGPTFR